MVEYSYGKDSYENRQLRRVAAEILDNPELLMLAAYTRGDVCKSTHSVITILTYRPTQSIPGTRNHYTKILCGYFDEQTEKEIPELVDPLPNSESDEEYQSALPPKSRPR